MFDSWIVIFHSVKCILANFVHTHAVTVTLPAFVRHMRIHIHVANVRFNCAFPACNKSFKKFSAFKTHCYRHKEGKSKLKSMPFTSFELTCHVDSCQVRCETLSRFDQRFKTDIREGRSISCPFQQCDKSFSVVSTFTAHVSRKHSDCLEVNLIDSVALPHGMNESLNSILKYHRISFAVILLLMVWNKTPLVKVWMKISF